MRKLIYNNVFVGIVRIGLLILSSVLGTYFIIQQFIIIVNRFSKPEQDFWFNVGQLIGVIVVAILFIIIILYHFYQARADFRHAVYQSRIKRVLSIAIFVIVEGGVLNEFRFTNGLMDIVIDGGVFMVFLLLILNDILLIFDKRNKKTKEILDAIDDISEFQKNL